MVDKAFCMSSYLAFRYVEREDVNFFADMRHRNKPTIAQEDAIQVKSHQEIDRVIAEVFEMLYGERLGILLSGGMDSACLASYMPGADAYTFRFLNGDYQKEELQRAEYYAKKYHLKLHYVDISWETIQPCIEPVLRTKHAPVHSIEPQLYRAALQAKQDGVERIIVGESADLIFGGMDQLLSEDWDFDSFVKRYTFTDPVAVLREPVDMTYLFERFRQGTKIDFLSFMDNVFSVESSSSYWNAFAAAEIPYTDPYAGMVMAESLDLHRVRNGESKYLIRELFASKYPEMPIPNKIPMPRPVDQYFADWCGPKRKEFREDIDMTRFTGNQKWQMWCLEYFLNLYDGQE